MSISRYKTAWYTHHLYAFGNTPTVVLYYGNYIADQRDFGHGVPATAKRIISLWTICHFDIQRGGRGSFSNPLVIQDKARYDTAYEV